MTVARLVPASADDRSDAAVFAGRAARWDPAGPVHLTADGQRIDLWSPTPFEVLATRAVRGTLDPPEVTVAAADLLAALAIATADDVDPGQPMADRWRAALPPADGWVLVEDVPAERIEEIARAGADDAHRAADDAGGHQRSARSASPVPAALLDAPALRAEGDEMAVTVPMRLLFALSGMGFAGSGPQEVVRVRATKTWLRLDARFGAVVRRRMMSLPLLV